MGTRPSSRCPHSPVLPSGAAALGGCRGTLPRLAQCSASAVQRGAVRSAPSRTGFVIASPPLPPSAGPTSAGSSWAPPPGRRASPGSPHWRPRSRAPSPPPAVAERLDTGEEQVRPCSWSPGPPAAPAGPGGDTPDAGCGEGGCLGLQRCWGVGNGVRARGGRPHPPSWGAQAEAAEE